MIIHKFRGILQNISSIAVINLRYFLVADLKDHSLSVALFKKPGPRISFKNKLPDIELLHFVKYGHFSEFNYNNFFCGRLEKLKNKRMVLLINLNDYRFVIIKISKETLEDSSPKELILKQLPEMVKSDKFIVNYKTLIDEEEYNDYLVTYFRIESVEEFIKRFNKTSIQFSFIIPFIYPFWFKLKEGPWNNVLDYETDKAILYLRGPCNKVVLQEYYFNNATEQIHNIEQIIHEHSITSLFLHSDHKIDIVGNGESLLKIHRSNSLKHLIASCYLFKDNVFDFIYSGAGIASEATLDKEITKRIILAMLSSVIILLTVLYFLTWTSGDLIRKGQEHSKYLYQLQAQADDLEKKNQSLRSDIISLNSSRYKTGIITDIMKVVSEDIQSEIILNEILIKKEKSSGYFIKLIGHSLSDQRIINFIDRLENRSSLSNIRLEYLENKSAPNNIREYSFSIGLVYLAD